MGRRTTTNRSSRSNPAKKWLMGGAAVLLLVVVAVLDYLSGRDFSFTLLYLGPIAIAIWFVGPLPGLVLCFSAAGSGMAIEFLDRAPAAALWNGGVRLGVYLVFFVLLSYLREHKTSGVVTPLSRK